jgi:hypothetical protein
MTNDSMCMLTFCNIPTNNVESNYWRSKDYPRCKCIVKEEVCSPLPPYRDCSYDMNMCYEGNWYWEKEENGTCVRYNFTSVGQYC